MMIQQTECCHVLPAEEKAEKRKSERLKDRKEKSRKDEIYVEFEMKRYLILMIGLVVVWTDFAVAVSQNVEARLEKDAVVVSVDGKLFTSYKFVNRFDKKPYLWPLVGPVSGDSVTTESSEPYPHHNSMWFGCDKMNGSDFWHHQNPKDKLRSQGPKILVASGERVVIEDVCDWKPSNGSPIMRDFRRISISAPDSKTRIVDFDIVWVALEKVRINKTNHSLFALRMTPEISVKSGGVMANAEGGKGEKGTFGKSSAWMDYYGTRSGVTEGAAILQHPSNRWYPSPWFTRDYGFFSATPMYWLDAGYIEFASGESVALSYRVIIHEGTTEDAKIDSRFKVYSEYSPSPIRGYMAYMLDEVLPAVAGYKFGQSRKELMRIEQAVQDSASTPALAVEVEARLLEVLVSENATYDAKHFICRQLSLIGGAKSVNALKDILKGSDSHLAEIAVFALARIDNESASGALLEMLPDVKGTVRLGLVDALGEQKYLKAVSTLNVLALSSDPELAGVAVSALGRIGGKQAVAALLSIWKETQLDVVDALFVALPSLPDSPEISAEVCKSVYYEDGDVGRRLIAARTLATLGTVGSGILLSDALASEDSELRQKAIYTLHDLPAESAARLAAGMYGKASNNEKVLVLGVFEEKASKGYVSIVRVATKSENSAVQSAAFGALGVVGDASDIGLLLNHAKRGNAAFGALIGLQGDAIAQDFIKNLGEIDSSKQQVLIEVMGERGDAEFSVALFDMLNGNDSSMCLVALKGLRRIGDEEALLKLIDMLSDDLGSSSYRNAVETCVAVISTRLADENGSSRFVTAEIKQSSDLGKASLMRILGRLQDESSLSVLVKFTQDSDPDVKDAAVRALARWPHESAIEPLIAVAESSKDLRLNVLALRGVARLLRSSSRPVEELLPFYEAGRAAAKRDEERKALAFSGVVIKNEK